MTDDVVAMEEKVQRIRMGDEHDDDGAAEDDGGSTDGDAREPEGIGSSGS